MASEPVTRTALRPLRALRYDPGRVNLAEVVVPPYDVIPPADRDRYAAASEHSAVHLVLPESPSRAGRLQIAVRDLEKIDEGDPLDLVPGARRDAETLDGFIEFLAGEVTHPGLRGLLDRFLTGHRFRERLRSMPAAETHHDYAGGLLEHTVAVATLCREAAQLHPRLNSDILLTAALLHDAGRTETFRPGVTIAVSEQGRLLGHVLAGVRMIDAAAHEAGLGDDVLLPILNAVAGHHGPIEGRRLETPEAVALYHANSLDARLGEALSGHG